jgi:hypothetical protein
MRVPNQTTGAENLHGTYGLHHQTRLNADPQCGEPTVRRRGDAANQRCSGAAVRLACRRCSTREPPTGTRPPLGERAVEDAPGTRPYSHVAAPGRVKTGLGAIQRPIGATVYATPAQNGAQPRLSRSCLSQETESANPPGPERSCGDRMKHSLSTTIGSPRITLATWSATVGLTGSPTQRERE